MRGMRRWERAGASGRVAICVMAGGLLAGCGLADSNAKFVPENFRDKAPTQAAGDAMPDVKALMRERRQEIFAGTVDSVQVGPAHPKGPHWMFCARPQARDVGGNPLAPRTYLIEIDNGVVGDRLPVDAGHWCSRERYEPV